MKHGDLRLHLEAFLALENALGSPVRARERLLRDFVGFKLASRSPRYDFGEKSG